jgi:hypothetical protein
MNSVLLILGIVGAVWAASVFFASITGYGKHLKSPPEASIQASELKKKERISAEDAKEKQRQMMDDMKQKMSDYKKY